ncbi:MAG: tetratricopeptide repeat protein, partial [Pseudoalteromonas nigrifaciens]|uniref:tetratricopeptide repeat protein n=1 Tax=Pseudoalteromonas nigrifaciens TaxID=28109 RepID=UPI003C74C88D
VIARIETTDKPLVQQAKLLARAGQYVQARQIYNTLFDTAYPDLSYELEHLNWYAQDSAQWQSVKNGYEKLLQGYSNIALVEIAYARHLLRQSPNDKNAINILSKYGSTSSFSNEVEEIWLGALANMPIDSKTDKQFQNYFTLYPFSSKGELQYQDFKKDLKARQILLADPAYQLWVTGDELLNKNKLNKAEPLLLKALIGRPQDGAIMRSLGILYLRLGDNKKSYQFFTNAQKYTADFAERETLQGLAKTAKFWLYIRQAKDAINNNEFKTAELKLNLAHVLEQDPDTVLYNKGLLQFAQGQYTQAAITYRTVLKNDPLNNSALLGLLEIAELEQNEQALTSFYNGLSIKQKRQIQQSYSISLSSQYRAKATSLAQFGNLEQAEDILKQAIEVAPEQSWLYYDLAFIYQQKGLTQKARTLFNNVLWQFPLNPQMRYSHALFLRSIDDYQGAIKTLQYIPFKSRDEGIVALEQQLQLNESLTQSERHLDAKNKATAIYHLSSLEAQNLTPLMQAKLSSSWYRIDEKMHAIKLIDKALIAQPLLSPYWHMLYGEWLLEQGIEEKTHNWFTSYTLPESATENEITQYV